MIRWFQEVPWSKYATRISTSVVYAITAAVAVNFFYDSGDIYSSGVTGIAQIISKLSEKIIGVNVPLSIVLLLLNVPLFILGWFKISPKFTIYTGMTVGFTY